MYLISKHQIILNTLKYETIINEAIRMIHQSHRKIPFLALKTSRGACILSFRFLPFWYDPEIEHRYIYKILILDSQGTGNLRN